MYLLQKICMKWSKVMGNECYLWQVRIFKCVLISILFTVFGTHLFFHVCSLRRLSTSWFGWFRPSSGPLSSRQWVFKYLGVPENFSKHTFSFSMPPGTGLSLVFCHCCHKRSMLHNTRIALESPLPLAKWADTGGKCSQESHICLSVDFSNPVHNG